MSRFDLGNPADFRQAVSGPATLFNSLAQRPAEEWDLLEGSYNDVIFHVLDTPTGYGGAVSQIQDSTGRRKVKFMFPYQDGQTTDDLGRKPGVFAVNILLHGDRYAQAWRRLLREFNKPQPGILVHPVRGRIRCAVEDITEVHEAVTRKAVAIQVTFIEHNFTIGDLERFSDDVSVKGALTLAAEAFSQISAIATRVQGALIFAQSIRTQIASSLASLGQNYAFTLARLNATFNNEGTSDIPTILPVQEGGLLNEDGTQAGTNFRNVASPNDPFLDTPAALISPSISTSKSVIQLEKEVNDRRAEIQAVAASLGQTPESSLFFYPDILELKKIGISIQEVLEKGKKSSRAGVVSYRTPRLMSIREVAFANGVDNDRVSEIETLNPELSSVNYIPEGTLLMVPV